VTLLDGGAWHLEIPPGPQGRYRLAQLDDYTGLQRRDFLWYPPLTFSLSARASSETIPGTWGFGLWNDPFSLSLGMGGGTRRFPSLPNAAWFFFASPQNYLSLQDHKPAQGFFAQTFQSPSIPAPILALGTSLLPCLAWSKSARLLRKLLRQVIKEDSRNLIIDATQWHTYNLEWTLEHIIFSIDGTIAYQFGVIPKACLGLVIWVDNQYASFPPDGRLSFGTLENPGLAWIEVKDIEVACKMSTFASIRNEY
jgi:hypothetical protein